MFQQMETLEANSQLQSDHIGFHDKEYRKRREEIVSLTKTFVPSLKNYPIIDYKPIETQTWSIVFDKLNTLYKEVACKSYLNNLELLKQEKIFTRECIPELKIVSEFLEKHTGFKLHPVSGLLSPKQFLKGLSQKTFYCTQYIRHSSQPLYTPEPDIIHEMLGHVPMFLDSDICQISELIGKVAMKCSENKIKELERIYWFTIEFGLVKENNPEPLTKIYGAGILSSYGEIEKIINQKDVNFLPFDISKVISDEPLITQMQNNYYYVNSFQELKNHITKYLLNYVQE